MSAPDRLERLTDLVLVLLASTRPLPLEEIAREVPGYPEEHGARRQAFERDKRLLRDDGIAVLTEPIGGRDQFGYRIDADSFYLPDLALSAEEQAALHLAVAGVHLGEPSGQTALLKLGAVGLAETRPVASVETLPALPTLFEAFRTRATVGFTYRGESRQVAPAGLAFRGGRWYLTAWDLDKLAARTFRVDRIDGLPEVAAAGTAELPADFQPSAAAPDEPMRAGDSDEDVVVAVDHIEAPRVVAEVGPEAVVDRRPDGSVSLRLGVTSPVALRSWVLGLLHHARVTGPETFRQEIVAWLEAIVAAPEHPSAGTRTGGPRPPVAPTEPAEGPGVPSTPGRDAARRLRRLLALVGWLARVGEAPITEVAERFGIDPDELVAELELAACCGVPPYTPDTLMEIVVTEDTVQAFLPADLARPRRITPAEGFALAAAGRTILAVPGAEVDGPLARALDKLEEVLGARQSLSVRLDAPDLLDQARAATEAGQQLEIDYHSASADETTTRVVDPVRVMTLEGHWYLDAFCHRAGDMRRFRIDRLRALRLTGVVLAPTGAPSTEEAEAVGRQGFSAFVPGPGSVMVELAVGGDAAWLADSVPAAAVEPLDGDELLVRLHVGGTAWLARLLLQLGPQARVLSPPELRRLGADAARRVLAGYHQPTATG